MSYVRTPQGAKIEIQADDVEAQFFKVIRRSAWKFPSAIEMNTLLY